MNTRPSPRTRIPYVPSGKCPSWIKLGEKPVSEPLVFAPIINIEGYIRDLDKTVDVEKVREMYTYPDEVVSVPKPLPAVPKDWKKFIYEKQAPPFLRPIGTKSFKEPSPKKGIDVPTDPTNVFTALKVLKNGTVRVTITVPMEPVYESQKKGKTAPLPVRVKACKGFGYSTEVLEKMIAHDDYMNSISKNLDNFIEGIFGQFANSKVSKPKVKTVQESINTKLKKKPAKKY